MRVLITGSSGFVGSNLYASLHTDFEIFGLDITKKGLFPENKVWLWNEMDKIPQVDTIIHLAGIAHDTGNTTQVDDYFNVNVGLTKQIYKHFLDSEARLFVYFSSIKAVTDNPGKEVVTEDFPCNPITFYGKSKRAAEEYLLETGVYDGKNLIILRPSMIHGPGNKGNLALLFDFIKKGLPWPLGAFHNQRSMISVYNVCYLLKKIISKGVPYGIYHLADDDPVSTNELVAIINESLNQPNRVLRIPIPYVRAIARVGDYIHLPLNSERLVKLTEDFIVSNQKIKSALMIERLPLSITEGLRHTFKNPH